MAVAKRQGREKPSKIEQRKVQGPEWGPQVEQTTLLTSPIYLGQAQGEKKMHKKKSRRAKGPGLSLFPVLWGTLLFVSLGQHPLMPRGWVVLLLSKQNRAVTRSCNTDLSKSYNMVLLRPESYNTVCPRSESCDMPRALMSVTANLCCDETEPREIHLPDKGKGNFANSEKLTVIINIF